MKTAEATEVCGLCGGTGRVSASPNARGGNGLAFAAVLWTFMAIGMALTDEPMIIKAIYAVGWLIVVTAAVVAAKRS